MSVLSKLVPIASKRFPRLSRHVLASSGYTLDVDSFGPDAFVVWDAGTAARQDRAWQPIVREAKAGTMREDVASLKSALAGLPERPATILESGCGGGYNSDLIALWYPDADYLGVDISEAMIGLATEHYPERRFEVGTAYGLPAADNSLDLVVDGVALIHMPDWQRAVAEYARVTHANVILHGVTVTDSRPTTRFAKYAYGQPSLELVFNRDEVVSVCEENGLRLVNTVPGQEYDLEEYLGIPSTSEAWVLEKA
jgi:SAM-dependent methyltransferase